MLGDHQQHDEQHQERQCVGEAVERGPALVGDQVADHVLQDADGQTTDERERDAGEAADGRRTEGVGGQEHQAERLEAGVGQHEDARDRGKGAADHPRHALHADRAGAQQFEQIGVVHGGTHLQAEAAEAEHAVERHDSDDGDGRGDQLVAEDVDIEDAVAVALAVAERDEPLDAQAVVGQRVEHQAQRGHGDREAHGADDLHRRPLPRQVAGDHLQDDAEQRAGEGDADECPYLPVPAQGDPQPVEEQAGRGEDGTVPEVEDARRLVREHQSGACQAVDHAGDQTGDDEGEQFTHGTSRRSCQWIE